MFRSLLLIGCVFFLGCEKPEKPVVPHETGESITSLIELGSDYSKQYFFDLYSDQIVAENFRSTWDLSFECGALGNHIILNSSLLQYAAYTEYSNFLFVSDTVNSIWKWDDPKGNFQNTALPAFEFNESSNVILLDLGRNEQGENRGIKKMQVLNVNNDSWQIRYSNLDNSSDTTLTIQKDNSKTFMQFSLLQHQLLEVMPEKNSWDLKFTTYTEGLLTEDNDSIAYLVVGVLINSNNVLSVKKETISFNDIDFSFAKNLELSSDLNTIGYDWKTYDFDNGYYTVNFSYVYIISDTNGYFYKLRFIDFYNDSGEKGNIKFEYQLL